MWGKSNMPFVTVLKLLLGLGVDVALALLTGIPVGVGIGIGLLDDALIMALGSDISFLQTAELTVFLDEFEHMVREGMAQEDQTEQEQQEQEVRLAHENPGTTYVFGDVSLLDVELLALSGGLLVESGFPETVFQVAMGLLA